MRAIIDTNVLADGIFAKEPFYSDAKRIFQLVRLGMIEGCVSVQSINEIIRFAKNSEVKVNPPRLIEDLTAFFHIIDVKREDIVSAIASDIEDLECGILVFSAIRNDVNAIITRDTENFLESDIIIIHPSEVDKYLQGFIEAGVTYLGGGKNAHHYE